MGPVGRATAASSLLLIALACGRSDLFASIPMGDDVRPRTDGSAPVLPSPQASGPATAPGRGGQPMPRTDAGSSLPPRDAGSSWAPPDAAADVGPDPPRDSAPAEAPPDAPSVPICTVEARQTLELQSLPFGGFNSTRALAFDGTDIVLLRSWQLEPGPRSMTLERIALGGQLLGTTDLTGLFHPELLVTPDELLMLDQSAQGVVTLQRLDRIGQPLDKPYGLRIGEVDVSPSSFQAAVHDDVVGIAYLLDSGNPVGSEGTLRFARVTRATFLLSDVEIFGETNILEVGEVERWGPRWVVSWAWIHPDGFKSVHLTVLADNGSVTATREVDRFEQRLQGGFPRLWVEPLSDDTLFGAWLDPRDTADQTDILRTARFSTDGAEMSRSERFLTERTTAVFAAEYDGAEVAVLLNAQYPTYATLLHVDSNGTDVAPADVFDEPDVGDEWHRFVWTQSGYALAGNYSSTGQGPTAVLQLATCTER